MKALLIGDVHLSNIPPSIRTNTYAEDILDKLRFCVSYANDNNIDVVVQLGDMWHLKSSSKTSHALVQATAAVFSEFKGRVLIVPGNHDLSQDRLESISKQPLGTLALASNIELIDGYDEETGIYSIPYLDDFDEFRSRLSEVPRSATLVATHASIFPPGFHPPYPHMNADELDPKETPVAYGHIHDPHGFYVTGYIEHISERSWFCNNGAISRGSLHEETVKRKPKVTIFDSKANGCPFTSVDVPHKPAEEVFRLEQHIAQQETTKRLDAFLETLEGTQLTSLSLEEVLASATTADLTPEAKKELAEILESVL